MDTSLFALSLLVMTSLPWDTIVVVSGDECGSRFTDFTSSVILAEVVLQGSVQEFNPTPSARNAGSANVSVSNVYKGMDVLKSTGRMNQDQQVIVHSFGQENKEDCVAPQDDKYKNQDMVFFLRTSRDRIMMEHSAMPLPAEGNEELRVKRSLCDDCVQPPSIRRLVCKDCAKKPTIRQMKSRKVTLGRKARLRCVARGKPAPKISWFKGDIPIMSGNGGVTIRTTALTSILLFTKTTSAHSGEYKCIASNELGEAEDFATLELSRRKPKKKKQKEDKSYSVKDAADKELCQTNLCLNGGTCYFSASLNLRQCVCASGFEGVKCENIDRKYMLTSILTRQNTTANNVVETTSTLQSNNISQTERVTVRSNVADQHRSNTVNRTVSSTSQSNSVSETERLTVSNSNSPDTQIAMCEASFCKNGGTCFYNAPLNTRECICTSGFYGIRCENSRPPATPYRTLVTSSVNRHIRTHVTNENNNNNNHNHNHNNVFPTIISSTSRSRLPTFTAPRIYPRPTSRYSVNGQRIPSHPVRKKSGLKIIFCKDKHYCANKGKCKYISKLNKKFCQCRKGYGGLRCERVL